MGTETEGRVDQVDHIIPAEDPLHGTEMEVITVDQAGQTMAETIMGAMKIMEIVVETEVGSTKIGIQDRMDPQ